ncbi:MAG: flavodoxin [Candidatus Aceula meridiana]|nr:flavodoxin [Candidatus Aceula meridiana]
MKLYRFLFIVIFLFLCSSETVLAQERAKTLVVYYSRTGNTRKVAKRIAEKFDADVEELIDQKKRTGFIGFSAAGKDALAHNLTTIDALKLNPQDYDVILIGTPSWFSNMTPAVRTFISQYDLSDKRVGVFATANKTGVKSTVDKITKIISKDDFKNIPKLPLVKKDLEKSLLEERIKEFYAQVISLE